MAACALCQEPLVLSVHDDGDDAAGQGSAGIAVPDDLELRCGCHFHWQCLLDEASSLSLSLKCPSCDASLPTNEAGPSTTNQFLTTSPGARIPARYISEGGTEDDIDLMPVITEEAYLEANPAARPARAMHIMCSEGDIEGIVAMLEDVGSEGTDMISLLRYQDPLSDLKSGLHLAVEKQQVQVVWLLLWLCSSLSDEAFPDEAFQIAASLGLSKRLHVNADNDIRSLRDAQGISAGDMARQDPRSWQAMLDAKILA